MQVWANSIPARKLERRQKATLLYIELYDPGDFNKNKSMTPKYILSTVTHKYMCTLGPYSFVFISSTADKKLRRFFMELYEPCDLEN